MRPLVMDCPVISIEYSFTNTTGSTQCVTVDTDTACTGTNFIFIASYLGSFDPANICTNWIGDSGSSPDIGVPAPFQFNLDDGQTVVIVVSEVTPDAGCTGYTVTVSGICGGGASPTPSPSATCIPGSPNGAAGPWTAGNRVSDNDRALWLRPDFDSLLRVRRCG